MNLIALLSHLYIKMQQQVLIHETSSKCRKTQQLGLYRDDKHRNSFPDFYPYGETKIIFHISKL